MECPLSNESYEYRRNLFKDIWKKPENLNDADTREVVYKPKIIKTLNLEGTYRIAKQRRKQQRLKRLQSVCTKILKFCDGSDEEWSIEEHKRQKSKRRLTRRKAIKRQSKHRRLNNNYKNYKMESSTVINENISRKELTPHNDDKCETCEQKEMGSSTRKALRSKKNYRKLNNFKNYVTETSTLINDEISTTQYDDKCQIMDKQKEKDKSISKEIGFKSIHGHLNKLANYLNETSPLNDEILTGSTSLRYEDKYVQAKFPCKHAIWCNINKDNILKRNMNVYSKRISLQENPKRVLKTNIINIKI
ncbi:unnamed protein product [Leptidea sinapis]|uniref:Uncharacterized protein n=1 Tax=Leptidea sinapis TaxID=189913 RepID=A0A5E4R6L3_9NEOP|nr:unnamed protein product [Leptidea sinapis]